MNSPEVWQGVEVPNKTELYFMSQDMGWHDTLADEEYATGPYLFLSLGGDAKMIQPNLDELSDFAQKYYLHDEADATFTTEAQRREFVVGITAGFDFFLGCMTYIRQVRSETSDITDLGTNDFPIETIEEKRTAKRLRAHGTFFDEETNEELINIAVEDYGDFASANPGYARLLESGCMVLLEDEESEEVREAFTAGYYDGLEFALQLYLASKNSAEI